jgi:hypothetical protein
MNTRPRCGARTALGTPCANYPMRGQERCRKHGGASPQARAAAVRRLAEEQARQAVETYGLPLDVSPEDALLGEVRRTAGCVAYLDAVLAEKGRDGLTQWVTVGGEDGGSYVRSSVWVDLHQRERAHLVAVCKAAIAAGIEERRVQLEERQGELVGELVRVAIAAAQVTPEQEQAAYAAVRGHLTRVA